MLDYQPGNLELSRQIVGRYQHELSRSCYLLTGDAQRARQLAAAALLAFFQELPDEEDPARGRARLLLITGRRFLTSDFGDAHELPPAGSPIAGDPQRYQVDGEPERLLAALDRLEPEDRLALVLREYARLDEDRVAEAVDVTPYQLHDRLEPARRRLRESVSASESVSLRGLLDLAARGAPRPNLWSLVEEPLREQARRSQQRATLLTRAVTGGVIVLLVGVAVWLAIGFGWLTGGDDDAEAALGTPSPAASEISPPTPVPEPSPTPLPDLASLGIPQADVASTLWLHAFERSNNARDSQRATYRYDLAANQLSQQQGGRVDLSVVSPDGRWILYTLRQPPDEEVVEIQLIDAQTGQVLWTKERQGDGAPVAYAFAGERIYALDQTEPSRLVVYDIETGQEIASRSDVVDELWAFEMHPFQPGLQLFASPDGSQLWVHLIASWSARSEGHNAAWGWVLASYSLPDLNLESRKLMVVPSVDGSLPARNDLGSAVWTPDGKYLVVADQENDQLVFYSPYDEEPLELELLFSATAGEAPQDLTLAPSNSGRYLYVLATERREVAIVDLLARKILRVAPIDAAGFGLFPALDAQGRVVPPNTVLSPDGSRLYVANAWSPTGRIGGEQAGAPISVIDTTTWQVVDQWDLPSKASLYLIDGGRKILAMHTVEAQELPSIMSLGALTVFDAETGEKLVQRTQWEIPLPEWVDNYWLESLYADYRRSYDRSPSLDGVSMNDAETAGSLPRVRLKTEAIAAPAGIPRQIEIRFKDPVTGDLITGPRPDVRFDPESIVSVTFHHVSGDVDDVLLILRRDDDGVYRASVTLDVPGDWDATVTVTPAEGGPWSVRLSKAINVTEALAGDDGRAYVMTLDWQPDEPGRSEPVTFTVHSVDAESGEPMSEGVELADGMPEEVDVVISKPRGALITVDLTPTDHGVYQGTGEIWGTGGWTLQLSFPLPETREYIRIDAGTIEVGG